MTIEGIDANEPRLDVALAELQEMKRQLAALTQRVSALETSEPRAEQPRTAPVDVPIPDDDSVWSWVGQSRVLPRVAMVCFALVVALVLRTLTDNGIIALELGVVLGVAYSALLIGIGWRLLALGGRGRRVLPVCGNLLLCSVVAEAHGSFGLLTAGAANGVLAAVLAVLTFIGLRYRSGSILAFAVLSTSVTAIALGFPHPDFPYTASVVLAGNAVAYAALRVGRMQWLSWFAFGLAVFLWLVWGFQANAFLRQPEEPVPGLHVGWFVPFVVAFALLYAGIALVRAFRSPDSTSAFHGFLPTANVLWAYGAALAVVLPRDSGLGTLSAIACTVSVAHFAAAVWLWRRFHTCSSAITSFAIAGTALFAVGTPTLLGSFALALPLWSAVALGLFGLSQVCGSTGLRLSSYGLQVLVCTLAITTDEFGVPSEALTTSLVSAALITALALLHHRSARRHPPPVESWVTRFDRTDRTAIVLFWVAAISGFGTLRLLAHEAVQAIGAEVDNTFLCTQSMVINCASIVLMLWGIRTRNGELLATAVLVATFGGLKVVASDLLNAHGVPLVLSVASFGAAAAVGSIVLGKWLGQRSTEAAA